MSNKHKFRWIIVAGIAVLAVALGVFAFIRWGKPEPGQAQRGAAGLLEGPGRDACRGAFPGHAPAQGHR